jgi:hypothetical protein
VVRDPGRGRRLDDRGRGRRRHPDHAALLGARDRPGRGTRPGHRGHR